MLAALVAVALLVPAIGAAAVREDPPPPAETTPPPTEPAPPEDPPVTITPEPPVTIEIKVPPLPDPVAASPKPKLEKPEPVRQRAHSRRVTPRRVEYRAEPETPSRADAAPVAKKKPAAKVKPKRKKPRQIQHVVVAAPVSAPLVAIRDRGPAHGVLAALLVAPETSSPPGASSAVLYLALALAAMLGTLFGLVGAAPVLAGPWPRVFAPVIVATERIVLAGVCLAGAALTLAITWVLTARGA